LFYQGTLVFTLSSKYKLGAMSSSDRGTNEASPKKKIGISKASYRRTLGMNI